MGHASGPASARSPVKHERRRFPRLRDLTWTWSPRSEREAGEAVVRNLLLHWLPAKVSRASVATKYSLWLGTISAVLLAVLTLTGVVLMFLYVPSVERAYGTIKDLEYAVSFGGFLRSLHRIAAHLMVAVVFLHMVRVFFTGAFKNGVQAGQNRPFNWCLGMGMLVLTLFLSFTGYLLPWDQLAYWAVTVGTNIAKAAPIVGEPMRFVLLGGHEIGQNTLIRFYVLHCVFLPGLLFALFAWHMWRIHKDGGLASYDRVAREQKTESAPPVPSKSYALLGITAGRTATVETVLVNEDKQLLRTVPGLVGRVVVITLLTLALCAVLALWLGSPLEEPANSQLTPNPAKAPWYFLWLQELVTVTTIRIGSWTLNGALVGGILVPGVLLGWGFVVPWLDRSETTSVGVWFPRERRLANAIFLVVCIALIVLTVIGTFMRGPYWGFYWPWQSWPAHPPRF